MNGVIMVNAPVESFRKGRIIWLKGKEIMTEDYHIRKGRMYLTTTREVCGGEVIKNYELFAERGKVYGMREI